MDTENRFPRRIPASQRLKGDRDDINCYTSVPGVFAAGDLMNIRTKQIIPSA
jgi:thioredoxin reductase